MNDEYTPIFSFLLRFKTEENVHASFVQLFNATVHLYCLLIFLKVFEFSEFPSFHESYLARPSSV